MQQNDHDPSWGSRSSSQASAAPPWGRRYFLEVDGVGTGPAAQPRPRPSPEMIFTLRPKHCGAMDFSEPFWPEPLGGSISCGRWDSFTRPKAAL